MQENNNIVPNVQLNDIVNDIRNIIQNARNKAYATINQNLIHSNWEIGRRIVEEEQLKEEIEKQKEIFRLQHIK